ncbi:MAG: type VI-B CRISPR-associated RNA-guided ribonuclease Cas13b [Saprospiraceae bacterium]|nr:type VI-B CRISPR-associated RNA-guided ribonuclease Cas13b [Saprospiraceae bacterium]
MNDIKSGELTKVALDKIPNPYSPSTKKFNTAKQVILKEKIEKRKIELNEKLKKYKLALDDLPKMILYYLLNIEHEDISLKVIPIIKSMQVETNHLLNKLQHNLEKRNKPGEKGSKLILSGELASFLAQDMLALQAKSDNSRDKANSQEYQHLQYKLAYYSLYIDEFKSIFKKLNLIDSDKFSHPFLSKLTKIFPNIIQFYEWYLNERKKWLMDIETKPEEALKFIKLKKSVNITGEQLVDQFLVKTNGNQAGIPYNFPRGIFDDAIKSELEKNDKMKAIISNTKRVNSHFLINRYIEHEKNNKSQSFYEWKRNYEIYDRLEDDRKKMFDPLPKK